MALRTEIFITSRPLYFPCRPHAPYSLSCCPVHLFRTLLLSFPLLSFPVQPFTPPIHIAFLSAVRGFIKKLNPFLPPGIVCLLPSESCRHTHVAVRPFPARIWVLRVAVHARPDAQSISIWTVLRYIRRDCRAFT